MIIYYDMRLFEVIPDENYLEELQKKLAEFVKRTQGFGVLSFRITPEAQVSQQQVQELQKQSQQYAPQEEADEIPSMEELEDE